MNITTKFTTLDTLGPNIHILAITGGPCSGKTTGLAKIVPLLKDRGYKVIMFPESATKLMQAGILPWEIGGVLFQRQILLDILMQEERCMEAARAYRDLGQKVVVLCDRGAMDGQAYIQPEEFKELVKSLGLSLHDICEKRYHAVFHLRTAALGAEAFYTLQNNETRKETLEEARELDQRTLEAWQRHYHPRVIDNSTGFDEKIARLVAEVCAVLGDPIPIEREQKYLIDPFDLSDIPSIVTESVITQDYLEGNDVRVRARRDTSGTSYFFTKKRRIAAGESIEFERLIGETEYRELLGQKNTSLRTVVKRRATFFYEGQFIETDFLLSPDGVAGTVLMEIEQVNASVEPSLPPFVKVIRNVTGDERYFNRSLAGV